MRSGTVDLLDWVTTAQLAELAHVDRTTALRWRRGDRPAPWAVLRLLELELGGHVGPAAGDDWTGFWFDLAGQLRPPDLRAGISAGEVRAFAWLRAQGCSATSAYTLMTGAGAPR